MRENSGGPDLGGRSKKASLPKCHFSWDVKDGPEQMKCKKLGIWDGIVPGQSPQTGRNMELRETRLSKAASCMPAAFPSFSGLLEPLGLTLWMLRAQQMAPLMSAPLLYFYNVIHSFHLSLTSCFVHFLLSVMMGASGPSDNGTYGSSLQRGGRCGHRDPPESSASVFVSPSPASVGARTWEDCKLYTLFPFWLGE